jgi:purine-binding chemotaxis protein CheW
MPMQLQELFSTEEMEILRLRADRIAAPLQEEDKTGHIAALIALMRGETYALPIDAITVTLRSFAIVPIPCVPKFVAGVANVRGHLVSVLDLAALLGLQSTDGTVDGVLVVVQADEINIGFHVEAIGDVIELSANDMTPVSPTINLTHPEYLDGIFPGGVGLLNIEAILRDPGLVIDESIV